MLCVNTRLLSFFLELNRFSVRARPLFPDVKNEKIQTETINQIDFISSYNVVPFFIVYTRVNSIFFPTSR